MINKIPDELINSFLANEVIAVIGSGPSIYSGFPTWQQLIGLLIDECEKNLINFIDGNELRGLLKQGLYPDVANACRKLLGGSLYAKFLRKIFCDNTKKPNKFHIKICDLPFCGVVTTNYDKLIEQSYLQNESMHCMPSIYTSKNIVEIANLSSEKKFFILKIHGDVDYIDSIVLTQDDYQKIIYMNHAFHFALSTIFSTKTLLFLGYGLSDPHLNTFFREQVTLFKDFGRRHFAFMADVENAYSNILSEKYNISVIPYSSINDHEELHILMANTIDSINKSKIVKNKSTKREKKYFSEIQQQLFQDQKMVAIGALAGGIAHDLNNFLVSIQSSTEIALLKLSSKHKCRNDLKQVLDITQRASSLIHQLLIFSRKQPIQFTLFNINLVIENIMKMLDRLIGEDISISFEMDTNIMSIEGDVSTFEQVILNLIVNARDAMPHGGTIKIQTENVIFDHSNIENNKDGNTQYIRIKITDSGIGMDQRTIDHIFEPFYTTKKPDKGIGLGLSVVYSIINQYNGWINVQSEPKKGTTFEILVPASKEKHIFKVEKETTLDSLHGNGESILVVEDERLVLNFTERLLTRFDYKVSSASTVTEAMNLFNEKENTFDLILSDVVLPDGNGVKLVEDIMQIEPNIKILLNSGYTDIKSQWTIIKGKNLPFLQKPYDLKTLLTQVRLVLNNKIDIV